jgi:type VI secretion system VasD/TssJ family lipoprotein
MGIKCLRIAGLVAGALMGIGAAIGACSHTPPPPATPPPPPTPCATPEPMRVSLQASQRLNPGEKGEALATVVRLYQLKASGKLTGASFDELLDHDHDALADDFLNVQEVTINPGDKLDPPMVRHADAAYVAAVALFRQPAGTTWRAVRKLPAPDPLFCHAGEHPDGGAAAKDAGAPPKAEDVTRFFLDENRLELR